MEQTPEPRRLNVAEQPKTQLYRMSIRFKMDLVVKDLAEIMNTLGFPDKPVIEDGQTLRIQQTVPFIPDDELLERYASIIAEAQGTAARFDGYDWIYAIEAENEQK